MLRSNIKTTQEDLLEKIQQTEDVVFKELFTKVESIKVFYIKTLSDEAQIQNYIIKPFYEIESPTLFLDYLKSHPKVKPFENEEKTLNQLLVGEVIVFFQAKIFLFDLKMDRQSSVLDTTVETTIQGPQSGFSESIGTNLGLVRQRYPQASLNMESSSIGKVSKTKVITLYDNKTVNQEVLKKVREFLETIDIEMFQSGEQLLDLIKKSQRALFPLMLITERADRVAINLAAGKVVLLVNGSPFAVILPTVMKDFMSSMADIYQTYWVGCFFITLRYIGLFISIVLPSIYVALTAYNPEVFRVQLALSIAGSRSTVPYPAFIEVFFMLIMMELLTEASIRLPKAIGPTATTVGGLILGQAATEAGLVSNIMIIIVSAVAISNFVVPVNNFGAAIRVVKYLLLVLSIFYGLVGVVIGFLLLVSYLVSLESFGKPFLTISEKKPAQN
ncbi:MAG: spore germination protein [Bacillota bacterium]|nr:spore germination protein [Bacillota bacterium]